MLHPLWRTRFREQLVRETGWEPEELDGLLDLRLRYEGGELSERGDAEELDGSGAAAIRARLAERGEPADVVLRSILVLPLAFRPLARLENGRLATGDLNDHYRQVVNFGWRLERMVELEAPRAALTTQARKLQRAVDRLFDNEHPSVDPLAGPHGPLLSLTGLVDAEAVAALEARGATEGSGRPTFDDAVPTQLAAARALEAMGFVIARETTGA